MPWARVRDASGRPRRGLTQPHPDDLEDHDQHAGAEERDRAAAAGLGDHPTTPVLSPQVDLDLGSSALLAALLSAVLQTCRLMTRPRDVRNGPNRTPAAKRSGCGRG